MYCMTLRAGKSCGYCQSVYDVKDDEKVFCRGDVEQLRRLVDSKVNPDVGEHDSRTAMHQVSDADL